MTLRRKQRASGSPMVLDFPNDSMAADRWGDPQRQGNGHTTIAFTAFDMGAGNPGEKQEPSEFPRPWSSHQEDAIATSGGGYTTPTKRAIVQPEALSLSNPTSALPWQPVMSDPATPAGDGTPRNLQDSSWPAAEPRCPDCTRMSNALKLLSDLRREEIVQRSNLESEERLHQQQLEHLVKLQARFSAIIAAAISRGGLDEILTELGGLSLDIQETHRSELAQREYIIELQKELRKLLFRQATKEEKLYKAIYSNDAAESAADTQIAVETQGDDVSITSKHSSSAYPKPVQEFYDMAGNFNIARERLIVLEEEHQEEVLERQRLKDAGRKLMPSQKIFMENYFNKRAELIRELLRVKNDKSRLRHQCLAQGYTLEQDSVDDELDIENLDHSKRFREKTGSRSLASQHHASRGLNPLKLMLLPNLYPEDHVRHWLTQTRKAQSSTSYRDPGAMLSDPTWTESKEAFCSDDLDSSTNIDGKWDHSTFEATSDATSDAVAQLKHISSGEWPGESLRKRYSSPELFNLIPRTDGTCTAPTVLSF